MSDFVEVELDGVKWRVSEKAAELVFKPRGYKIVGAADSKKADKSDATKQETAASTGEKRGRGRSR